MKNTPPSPPVLRFIITCAKKLQYKTLPSTGKINLSSSTDMKEPSSIKAASIAARPSPLGSRHPSTRVSRSGPQFFPKNILENEGDSDMNAETTQPPAIELSTHNSGTAPETSPILGASESIHAPETNEDSQMETPPAPSPFPPQSPPSTKIPAKPIALGTLAIEEINLHAHIAMAEHNCSIIKSSAPNTMILLPQFTPIPNGSFPNIHLAHAAQLFDYQAPKVINAWLKVPNPKIFFHIFNYDRKNPSIATPILVEHAHKAFIQIRESLSQDLQDVKISPALPRSRKGRKGLSPEFSSVQHHQRSKIPPPHPVYMVIP
ncbi:hypothetical protein C8R48DRAFT_767574 [Suillus tomentosus]|nr:hypothetical protein C8R48DRAFT_767574 [Suillus tomentosus]